MSQAYDREGAELGPEHFGDSLKEAFNKANEAHPEADKIVTRKLPESGHRLTNLDIATHYSDVRIYMSRKDFLGPFANWVVRQSPYAICPGLLAALVAFDAYVLEQMGGKEGIEEFKEFSYDELNSIVSDEAFEKIPAVLALNVAKIGSGPGWQSRYEKPHPDYDFIDLGALARNVFYDIIRNHLNWAEEGGSIGPDAAQVSASVPEPALSGL